MPLGLDEDETDMPPRQELVKLISKEGHEFIVDRDAVLASGTIRTLLTGPGGFDIITRQHNTVRA